MSEGTLPPSLEGKIGRLSIKAMTDTDPSVSEACVRVVPLSCGDELMRPGHSKQHVAKDLGFSAQQDSWSSNVDTV